jgi:hypothetical protein
VVFLPAAGLAVFPVQSMPFSLNRGQTNVVPLSVTFSNEGAVSSSSIRLTGLTVRLEDQIGGEVVPANLFSRVVVNEGTNVFLERSSLEVSGSAMDLTLDEPVLLESGTSSEQVTLSISLDIAEATLVPSFRLVIDAADSFRAEDAASGAPVSVVLDPSENYPIESGLARVVAEATELQVSLAPGGTELYAGQGQEALPWLTLELMNPGPAGLGADAKVGSLGVALVDSAGTLLSDPARVLERVRVRTAVQTLVDRPLGAGDDTTIALLLSPLLAVPVEDPLQLFVEGDIASDAELGVFRLRMASSQELDARDANTGNPLPVLYSIDPLEGSRVMIQAPADTVSIAGASLFPPTLPVGATRAGVLRAVLTHAGAPPMGSIRCDSLAFQCADASGAPLVPGAYLDRLRVLVGGTEAGLQTDVPASGGEIRVVLQGVVLTPGESTTLEVEADFEASSPTGFFEMKLGGSGIFAYDANLAARVTVAPSALAELPVSSGLTQLTAPPRELAVGFASAMPAVLVADGLGVPALSLTLHNTSAAPASAIRVASLRLSGADRSHARVPLGALLSRVEALRAEDLAGEANDLALDALVAEIEFLEPLEIAPGETLEISIRATPRVGLESGSLRLGLTADDIGIVQPASPLPSISAVPESGQIFPFWTEPGNISGVSLAESYSNFPNPFAAGRDRTTFAFFLREPASVTLRLWTTRGESVRTLLDASPLEGGLHQEIAWDGRNGNGEVVRNGVYVAEILTVYGSGAEERVQRKVAVVR